MEHLLNIEDLCVTYRNKERKVYAVRNASIELNIGDSLGIVGESGSGKSTLAMAAIRLLPQGSAEVTGKSEFMGQDILTLDDASLRALRWKNFAVVFQKAMNSLSPVHRISTQIEDIYRVHEPDADRQTIRARALELFRMVGLPERAYHIYPHEMSGGMLQRVSIAISLLHHPQLVIFDEATTALDVVTQGQILQEVVRLEQGMSMARIMITHDMSVVAASCSKVAVMYAGRMMETGPAREVLKNPMHPYSKGLLASFPSLRGERRALNAISGFLPDMSVRHAGCLFASRCHKATVRCREAQPAMTELAEGHRVACWLYGGDADEQ